MANTSKYLEPDKDYLSLLISGSSTRKHFQMFLSSNPNAPTANKLREALALHALIIAAERLIELRNQQSTTEEEIS
ncbi:hypothetical protein [Pantoea dispersa]|uniref:hypothetical protein n=1 Tax=Pantoea dispersa TaxID=59814 RepID=UPI001CA6082E|nr:hypothetical protein [Pantoea dispersa]QZY94047.1 hypothetical protein K7X52_15105 [Pantoea dispersa]